jgi:very-short-patch-repair endonuclease
MNAARLRRITRHQLGLFTHAQAIECHFSRGQIDRRVHAGLWKRVLGNVLAEAGLIVTAGIQDRAAHLAVPGSVLAGCSAARLWNIATPGSGPTLVVARRVRTRLPGVQVSRDSLGRGDVSVIDGALVTSRQRTIVDCLRRLPDRAALDLLDRALQRQWIHLDELTAYAHALVGRRRAPRLVRLLAAVSSGSRSAAERRLAVLLRDAGLRGWTANLKIYDDHGLVGVADVAFEEAKVVIEVDGWAFHVTPDQFQRDRERQNRLVAAGWTVLRFTWRDLTERPAYVVRTIRDVTG